MKKYIFVILLIFCGMQVWSQKTVHVNKANAKAIAQETQGGSKLVSFTITGFSSEAQSIETVQAIRVMRGVEEIVSDYDAATGTCTCTGRFYKYANRQNFSFMMEKAGIGYIELNGKTMPVADFKNSEL